MEAKINAVAYGQAKPIEAQQEFQKQLDGTHTAEQEEWFNLRFAQGRRSTSAGTHSTGWKGSVCARASRCGWVKTESVHEKRSDVTMTLLPFSKHYPSRGRV